MVTLCLKSLLSSRACWWLWLSLLQPQSVRGTRGGTLAEAAARAAPLPPPHVLGRGNPSSWENSPLSCKFRAQKSLSQAFSWMERKHFTRGGIPRKCPAGRFSSRGGAGLGVEGATDLGARQLPPEGSVQR